ncbi:MAG: PH domain-containing protein [Methanoregulaceae archaeon]|nr:PH domain-containing protein [Methanoregulaceae archaeon]
MDQDLRESGDGLVPSPRLRTLYNLYLILVVWLAILPWFIPLALFSPPIVSLLVGVPLLALVLLAAWWIPKYYQTILYTLQEEDICWRRGVWFRQTGIVPYNRITNVDIIQGPLARIFGLSSLRIQTAGYSAQAPAELVLAGIVNPEEIRDIIMGHVHSQSPLAVETYGGSRSEGASIRELHGELVRIRTLLEEGQKR